MVGEREIQLGEVLKELNSKKLISIGEIDGIIDVCYRVLGNLVQRTKERENWKKRALKSEADLKLVKGRCKDD